MTDTAKKARDAYNEFIANYVENHGECAATRNEAHQLADQIESMAAEIAAMCFKYAADADIADDAAGDLCDIMIDSHNEIDNRDDAYALAAWNVTLKIEALKNDQ